MRDGVAATRLLHQHRRQRQHVRNIVEPVPGIVLGKIVGRMDVDAQKIADGVVVLAAVQPSRGHAAGIGRRDAVDARELALEPRRDGLARRFLGLVLFERRYVAALQHADHVFPVIALFDQRAGGVEGLEVEAVLRFAFVAVELKQYSERNGLTVESKPLMLAG